MSFNWNYENVTDFVFENINIDTLTKCVVSIVIVLFLAFANESIKIFQKYVNNKLSANWMLNKGGGDQASSLNSEESPLVRPLRNIPVSPDEIRKLKIRNHIIQSLLYMLNLFVGYVVMCISMDYYSGHFLAIILGYTFGYYFLHSAPDLSPSSEQSPCHAASNASSSTTNGHATTSSRANYQTI